MTESGVKENASSNIKKKTKNEKKKNEALDKDVWNITGGLYPLKPSYNNSKNLSQSVVDQRRQDQGIQPSSKWVFTSINQNNKEIGDIKHWIQKENKEKVYALEKFNIKHDIVEFTDEEYNEHLKELDNTWDLDETRYLWSLVHKFDQRWVVIADAYNNENRCVEDIKKRYYDVSRKMLQVRNEKSHPIYNYEYNAEYEKIRKFELEKYLIRTKEQNEEEKKIMEELKVIQALIKKEEREQITVKRILQQEIEDPEILNQDEDEKDIYETYQEEIKRKNQMKNKKYFLRGKWIEEPLPLPPKFNKRLKVLLEELNVPTKILPTQKNEELFDNLRESILKIFSISKFIQRKETEKRRLQARLDALEIEKKNQQAQQQQQQQQSQQQNNNQNNGAASSNPNNNPQQMPPNRMPMNPNANPDQMGNPSLKRQIPQEYQNMDPNARKMVNPGPQGQHRQMNPNQMPPRGMPPGYPPNQAPGQQQRGGMQPDGYNR